MTLSLSADNYFDGLEDVGREGTDVTENLSLSLSSHLPKKFKNSQNYSFEKLKSLKTDEFDPWLKPGREMKTSEVGRRPSTVTDQNHVGMVAF